MISDDPLIDNSPEKAERHMNMILSVPVLNGDSKGHWAVILIVRHNAGGWRLDWKLRADRLT